MEKGVQKQEGAQEEEGAVQTTEQGLPEEVEVLEGRAEMFHKEEEILQ